MEEKDSVIFGTETSPRPSTLRIQAHNMDIYQGKKNPRRDTSTLWPVWGRGDMIKAVKESFSALDIFSLPLIICSLAYPCQ